MMTETSVAPVLRSVTVRCPVEEAFRIFTEEIGAWWPLETHSRSAAERGDRRVTARTVVLEPGVGGRVYEVMSDGSRESWGEVLTWEPPAQLVLSWKPHPRPDPPTVVDIRFTPDGSGTRVDLEHRGWERLDEAAREVRAEYVGGWAIVLGGFVSVAGNPS